MAFIFLGMQTFKFPSHSWMVADQIQVVPTFTTLMVSLLSLYNRLEADSVSLRLSLPGGTCLLVSQTLPTASSLCQCYTSRGLRRVALPEANPQRTRRRTCRVRYSVDDDTFDGVFVHMNHDIDITIK